MPKSLGPQELLARLVGFDTTSAKPNRACIDFIRDYLETFGVKSDVLAADGDKACLWATLGGSEKDGLVLAGHTDVVPVDGQSWASDPFRLTERSGKLYGRGSCDMKAFIACVLSILPELASAKLKQPIHIALTHDEESDMSGAKRLADVLQKRGVKPEWVWIGEPTEMHIIDSHKGVAAYETKITGIPGHSGMPDKGLNAIDVAADFIGILRRIGEKRKAAADKSSRFDPPYTTLNLGTIKGGTATNIIAGECELRWQLRVHPGDTSEVFRAEAVREAEAALRPRFAAFAPHAGMKTCNCLDIPALLPTANNPGERILGDLTGHKKTQAVSFATEGGFYQGLGAHVVVCGPGSIAEAHKADEFVDKNQITSCVDVLQKVLINSRPA